MRIAIDQQHPADDIIATVLLTACLIFLITVCIYAAWLKIAERKTPATTRLVGPIFDQMFVDYPSIDPRDILRHAKEQDAKDQETLDRATEYRNGISN